MSDVKCPYCNGTNLNRKGYSERGHQRYLCKDCNRKFTDNISEPVKNVDRCPYCNSDKYVLKGHLINGEKRYECKECGKTYSIKTITREKLDKICPRCRSDKIRRNGFEESGKQRYKCSSCNKYFTDKEPRELNVYPKTCPKCGNIGVHKAGKEHGKQNWICVKCNHKFLNVPKSKTIPQEIIDKIIPLLEKGYMKIEVAGELGISVKTVHNYSKGFSTRPVKKVKQKTVKLSDVKCPYCGTYENRKDGFISGAQRYQCKHCGKKFTERTIFPIPKAEKVEKPKIKKKTVNKITEEIISKMEELLEKNYTKTQVAAELKLFLRTVQKYTKGMDVKIKEKRDLAEQLKLEKLKEQKELQRLQKAKLEEKKNFVSTLRYKYQVKLKEFEVEIPTQFISCFNDLSERFMNEEIDKYTLLKEFNILFDKVQEQMNILAEEKMLQDKETRLKNIVKDIFKGVPENIVMDKYKATKEELKKLIYPFYEKEQINSVQQQTIVKFGVKCGVPVEYIAPYIPCSIKLCSKILSQYKIPTFVKKEIDIKERNFDRVWLDSFVR